MLHAQNDIGEPRFIGARVRDIDNDLWVRNAAGQWDCTSYSREEYTGWSWERLLNLGVSKIETPVSDPDKISKADLIRFLQENVDFGISYGGDRVREMFEKEFDLPVKDQVVEITLKFPVRRGLIDHMGDTYTSGKEFLRGKSVRVIMDHVSTVEVKEES